MDFIKKLRKTLWLVDEGGFGELEKTSVFDALLFFGVTVSMGCFITSLAAFLSGASVLANALLFLVLYVLGWGAFLPISAQIILLLVGWNKPSRETFKACLYGATPAMLFGWVPCLGFFANFVSAGNAIRYLHGNEVGGYWKPLLAVAVPFLLLTIGVFYLTFVLGQPRGSP